MVKPKSLGHFMDYYYSFSILLLSAVTSITAFRMQLSALFSHCFL